MKTIKRFIKIKNIIGQPLTEVFDSALTNTNPTRNCAVYMGFVEPISFGSASVEVYIKVKLYCKLY